MDGQEEGANSLVGQVPQGSSLRRQPLQKDSRRHVETRIVFTCALDSFGPKAGIPQLCFYLELQQNWISHVLPSSHPSHSRGGVVLKSPVYSSPFERERHQPRKREIQTYVFEDETTAGLCRVT